MMLDRKSRAYERSYARDFMMNEITDWFMKRTIIDLIETASHKKLVFFNGENAERIVKQSREMKMMWEETKKKLGQMPHPLDNFVYDKNKHAIIQIVHPGLYVYQIGFQNAFIKYVISNPMVMGMMKSHLSLRDVKQIVTLVNEL